MNERTSPHPSRRMLSGALAIALIVFVGWLLYAQGCRDRAVEPSGTARAAPSANAAPSSSNTDTACVAGEDCAEMSPVPLDPRVFGVAGAAEQDYVCTLVGRLAKEHDGRSQALAMLLLRFCFLSDPTAGPGVEVGASLPDADAIARHLRRNALALSPSDGLVAAWLIAGVTERSERDRALAHWQRLEPWNLSPLLHALPDPEVGDDAKALAEQAQADARLLPRLPAITAYDSKRNPTLHAVVDAMRRHPPTPAQRQRLIDNIATARDGLLDGQDDDALALVMGEVLWRQIEDTKFRSLKRLCGIRALEREPQRVGMCRALGARIRQRSDTLSGTLGGTGLSAEVAAHAKDEAMAAEILMARHRLAWLKLQYAALQGEDATPIAARRAARQALARHEVEALMGAGPTRIPYSEQDLMRAVLVAMGKSPEPPPEWRSKFSILAESAAASPAQR
jgi:hypothetical protein